MDAVKYLKEKGRMTKKCGISCYDCLLGRHNNGMKIPCQEFEIEHPEKVVEIVEKWAAEHPPKTRQSEFLKMFPDANVDEHGVISISPCELNTKEYTDNDCKRTEPCDICRHKYWSQEVE